MLLLVDRPLGRVDLDAVRRTAPLEFGAENARRLEARILRRLNQEHRNTYPAHRRLEALAKIRVARPAQRRWRNRHCGTIAHVSLCAAKRLNTAVRASRSDEPVRIDERLLFHDGQTGELIVELLGLEQTRRKLLRRGDPAPISLALHGADDVFAF